MEGNIENFASYVFLAKYLQEPWGAQEFYTPAKTWVFTLTTDIVLDQFLPCSGVEETARMHERQSFSPEASRPSLSCQPPVQL